MAKNSAKSKGYRKSAKKKPYLSKRDIIITACVAGAVLLGILLFVLFYSDGSLKIVDGVAQTEGAHSLIVNGGTGRKPIYYKVGQLAEMEGYTLSEEPAAGDENVRKYTYTPDRESPADRITCTAYSFEAPAFAEATLASYVSADNMECSEMQTMELDGRDVHYFTLRSRPVEGAVSEDAPAFVQLCSAYISVGDRCISVGVRNDADAEAEFVDDAVLLDILHQALDALSFETK